MLYSDLNSNRSKNNVFEETLACIREKALTNGLSFCVQLNQSLGYLKSNYVNLSLLSSPLLLFNKLYFFETTYRAVLIFILL